MPKDLENDPLFEEEDHDGDERALPESEGDEQLDGEPGQGESERLAEDEDGDDSEDQGRDESEDGEERPNRVDPRVNDRLNSRQRRSQGRYREVEAERNHLREENARITAEKAAFEARQQAEQAERLRQQQLTEAQRLEMMTPEERNAYRLDQIQGQIRYQEQMRVFERQDAQDKASYDALATVNPLYKRHAKAVENSLAQLRQQGQNMPREVLLRYHVGEEMLKNSQKNSKPLNPTKTRQVPRPNNSRADVPQRQGARSKPSSDFEKKKAIEQKWGDTPL